MPVTEPFIELPLYRMKRRINHKSGRLYPVNKFAYSNREEVVTNRFQPIENRDIVSSYAKTCPYDKVTSVDPIRSKKLLCGFDYVLDYWMARYFKIME